MDIKKLKENYTCKDAKEDIDLVFSGKSVQEHIDALDRALDWHMTVGTTVEKHNISCQSCWDYYQEMKRRHCGG